MKPGYDGASVTAEARAETQQVSQAPERIQQGQDVGQSPYLTSEQVARRYHASVRAIRDWVADDRLPYIRRPHARRLLFLRAHLDAWDVGAELERVELPDGGVCVRPVTS
jgi:hypothetical protein